MDKKYQQRERGEVNEGDIRYVDSQDLFDNFNFDEEIECTSTRVAYFAIAGGFFAARASFWTTKATLVQTGGEDTPFLGADLCLEKCGRIWVRFRRLRRLGTFWECVRLLMTCAAIEFNDRGRATESEWMGERGRERRGDMILTDTSKLMT